MFQFVRRPRVFNDLVDSLADALCARHVLDVELIDEIGHLLCGEGVIVPPGCTIRWIAVRQKSAGGAGVDGIAWKSPG